jgi:cytochrome c553
MAQRSSEVDVVVIGVGMVGSVVAKELAAAGHKVVGLERGQARFTVPEFQSSSTISRATTSITAAWVLSAVSNHAQHGRRGDGERSVQQRRQPLSSVDMIRVSTRRVVRTSGLLALFTACAFAATPSSVVRTRPPTANGAPCEACHGALGEGAPPAAIPRLAGQSADYLEKQLQDYENGSRENPVMRNFARGLSGSERAQLGAYYATLSAPYAAPVVADNALKVDAPIDARTAIGHAGRRTRTYPGLRQLPRTGRERQPARRDS